MIWTWKCIYSDDTGDIEVFQFKFVVDEVEDPLTQISLEEARQHDPSIQIDDEMGFRLKVEDLGRIAAQSAKQVIIQRMRDAEQELIYEEFKDRVGEIVSGMVQRRDKGGWVINLGRTEALLPREEQIPREHYKRNDRIQALIIDVRREGRGPQVIISRAHRDYMAALFRREVPEVDDGSVQIMGVGPRSRFPRQGGRALPRARHRSRGRLRGRARIPHSEHRAGAARRAHRHRGVEPRYRHLRPQRAGSGSGVAHQRGRGFQPSGSHRAGRSAHQRHRPQGSEREARGQAPRLEDRHLHRQSRYHEANAAGRGLEQVASVAEIPVDRLMDAGFRSLDALRAASDDELAEKLELSAARIADLRAAVNFLSPVVEGEGAEEEKAEAGEE